MTDYILYSDVVLRQPFLYIDNRQSMSVNMFESLFLHENFISGDNEWYGSLCIFG